MDGEDAGLPVGGESDEGPQAGASGSECRCRPPGLVAGVVNPGYRPNPLGSNLLRTKLGYRCGSYTGVRFRCVGSPCNGSRSSRQAEADAAKQCDVSAVNIGRTPEDFENFVTPETKADWSLANERRLPRFVAREGRTNGIP